MPVITTASYNVPLGIPEFSLGGPLFRGTDTGSGDRFGEGTALNSDGTILVAGAIFWDGGAGSNQGAVYTFDWNGSSWVQRGSPLTPSDAQAEAFFGRDVALTPDGNTLVVGASNHIDTISDQGKVYVFDWNGSAWIERESFISPNPQASEGFGLAISISADGQVIAVGSAFGAVNTAEVENRGGVYIYDWNGSQFQYRNQILNSVPDAHEYFGFGLHLTSDGSTIFIGALETEVNVIGGGALPGSFYVYNWNGSSWIQTQGRTTASDAGGGDTFGARLSAPTNNGYLAVGAWNWDGTNTNQGKVYIFKQIGGVWTEDSQFLLDPSPQTGAAFGSVGVSGDGQVMAVGAYGRDSSTGGVYRFD